MQRAVFASNLSRAIEVLLITRFGERSARGDRITFAVLLHVLLSLRGVAFCLASCALRIANIVTELGQLVTVAFAGSRPPLKGRSLLLSACPLRQSGLGLWSHSRIVAAVARHTDRIELRPTFQPGHTAEGSIRVRSGRLPK